MALRTMATKLGQKASSVTRVAKFSRARAKTSTPSDVLKNAGIPSDVLKNADPGVCRDLEELLMLQRKMQRDTDIAQAASACLALGTLVYFIGQARS